MAKVSVIIPTHNRAELLPRAVESAKTAGTDIEIIVVDNASTDETPRVCSLLHGIKYVRLERNLGPADARNTGIIESSSEYVSFLDDDDLRLPQSLDIQIQALEREPQAGFVYAKAFEGDNENCTIIGELPNGECPAGDIFWLLLEKNFISTLTVVVRRQCLIDVGLFDTEFLGIEDWDMWIRLAERFSVIAVEEPVAIYRMPRWTSGQLSSNQSAIWRLGERVQAKGLRLPRAMAAPRAKRIEARRKFLNSVSDTLICGAADALKHGATRQARMNLLTALRLHPLRATRPWTLKLLLKSYRPRTPNVEQNETQFTRVLSEERE